MGGLFTVAADPIATLVFGHGAGADMRHATMQSIAEAFAAVGISSLRFNFPFKETGKFRVDSKDVSTGTIKAAFEFATEHYEGPYCLGGHSFGGRMTSHAVLDHRLDVAALIFCAFPLHPAGKPSVERARHMDAIETPMLFLSGDRDKLAERRLMTQVTGRLGATLRWLDTGDHGYRILKRSRVREDDIFAEMAGYARQFVLKNVCP
ncbi:MAG: alpha/beta hydrolase [Gammaproteobacteria bacterium]|nr:alpha/beta hydrolase [Gammaproteobacteria bacterium]